MADILADKETAIFLSVINFGEIYNIRYYSSCTGQASLPFLSGASTGAGLPQTGQGGTSTSPLRGL